MMCWVFAGWRGEVDVLEKVNCFMFDATGVAAQTTEEEMIICSRRNTDQMESISNAESLCSAGLQHYQHEQYALSIGLVP